MYDPNRRYRELLKHVGHDIRIVSTSAVDSEGADIARYVTVDCRQCRVVLEQVHARPFEVKFSRLRGALEILRAMRARRTFFTESPDHDATGRGWYLGGDLLDMTTREYSTGGGVSFGPLTVNFSHCTCGHVGQVSIYFDLPSAPNERRRMWAQVFRDERPRLGLQRFKRPLAVTTNDS